MKRFISAAIAIAIVLCHAATFGQAKGKEKEISKPPKGISWRIKDKETDVEYHIIPVENINPKDHKKCRELIKEDKAGFMFFIVLIDNSKGAEPIKFSAFGGDAHFFYHPPKGPKATKKDPPPEPRKYGFVSLKNFFADKSNAPADKANYKKIQSYFKTNLNVAAGAVGWSLTCIRDGFIFDVKRNRVTWAIPGDLPQEMKTKKYNRRLLKKANVVLFDEK